MKVSIVTLFDNGNYGSELQAFALYHYLTNKGHDVTLCHIKASNRLIRLLEVLYDRIVLKINVIFNNEKRQYYNDRINNANNQCSVSPKLKHFIHCFVTKHIVSKRISRWNFPNKEYDVYVCGSD